MSDDNRKLCLECASQIVASYISNHTVEKSEIKDLLEETYQNVVNLTGTITLKDVQNEYDSPAVPVEKSITDDYLICLEDGKRLKLLKRYLKSRYNMTPDMYRTKWGLPKDYPMVAPSYAQRRSHLAKEIGLGRAEKSKGTV